MTKQTEKKNKSSMENNNDLRCPTLRKLNTRYLCNQNSGKSFFPHLSAVYDHVQKLHLDSSITININLKHSSNVARKDIFSSHSASLQPGVKNKYWQIVRES